MRRVKIAPGVTYTLLDAAPEPYHEPYDDLFFDDLMDVGSSREERKKARWTAQVSNIEDRLKSGEFDHYLEELFQNWGSTGFRDAMEKTKWWSVVRDEMEITGFTENDLRKFAKHLSKPRTNVKTNLRELTAGTYGSRILHSLIVNKFSNDAWNEIETNLKGNPYKWIFFHSLKDYADNWLVKNGYWQETQGTMNEAKEAINQVVEASELDDLMNVDVDRGFSQIDKEGLMLAAWNRPRNLSRDTQKSKILRITNSVEDFVMEVGSALQKSGYEMPSLSNAYDLDGMESTVPVVPPAIMALAVDWAGDWLVKNGHMDPESLPHLKEMFS